MMVHQEFSQSWQSPTFRSSSISTSAADATDADSFTGAAVIVYYFGGAYLPRTAVALWDLGPGPLEKVSGAVVKFDNHEDVVTIKTNSGAEGSFHIDGKTVAETAVGAVEGRKFDPESGDQVRVVAIAANGVNAALFIRAK